MKNLNKIVRKSVIEISLFILWFGLTVVNLALLLYWNEDIGIIFIRLGVISFGVFFILVMLLRIFLVAIEIRSKSKGD